MAEAKHITDEEFNELLTTDVPLVVDCTAPWCGPCRRVGPLIDQLATEYEGRAKVTKLNIDEYKASASKYGVRSIPAVLMFKEGELVENLVGVAPYETFSEALEKHI